MERVLRCIHRHTIREHPNCFARGLVKDGLLKENKVENAANPKQLWYQEQEYRIGYLDIETTGLKADFSQMLSWCIKEKDGEILYDTITKQELFEREDVADFRIVASLCEALKHFAIIVTYYGTGFDLPYARVKALKYGLEFPDRFGFFHWDLYYTVKAKLKLSSRSLENTCEYLGIEGKTPLSKRTWAKAAYGNPKAVQEVLEHNKGDVTILEELHNVLEPFAKWTKRPA